MAVLTGIFLSLLMGSGGMVSAQAYVDLFQVRWTNGLTQSKGEVRSFQHLWAGSDLPVRMKGNAILLFSPYYEQWEFSAQSCEPLVPTVRCLSLPVGLILPFKESKWRLSMLPIIRTSGEKLFGKNTFQAGGAAMLGYERKPDQTFRLGVYINDEFFGLFIIPLLGIDWRVGPRDRFFGILPGRLTYEHRWNDRFYSGATFRAPTTSYRFEEGHFIRIDENQLSLFTDFYITPHLCVTLEPGVGVFRELRSGLNNRDYTGEFDWKNGFFLRVAAQYRIRLDKPEN